MLITEDKITEIYCLADDFCKLFSMELIKRQIEDGSTKKHRNKPNKMTDT